MNLARRALRTRRVGHAGTLDPFASGLLLLCVEQATRLAEYLMDLPKTYVATARFDGWSTTDDATGDIEFTGTHSLSAERVHAALMAQVGTQLQIPSTYSAKKIGGVRAYELARRGETVELAASEITIHELRVLRIDLPEVVFEVHCSSGTYVRAIARDVGRQVGTGAYLSGLRRTAIGPFDLTRAVTPDRIGEAERISMIEAVAHMPRVEVSAAEAHALRFGQPIPCNTATGVIAAVRNHELLAIATADGQWMRPRKVFASQQSDDNT